MPADQLYPCFINRCGTRKSNIPLCEKCPYSEIFGSVFSHIRTEYGEIFRTSPYSVRMRENTDQKNSEYRHFSRSGSKVYLEPSQTFMMGLFEKTTNGQTIFVK